MHCSHPATDIYYCVNRAVIATIPCNICILQVAHLRVDAITVKAVDLIQQPIDFAFFHKNPLNFEHCEFDKLRISHRREALQMPADNVE